MSPKIMYPNYCFIKSSNEPGYEVIRRNYINKECSNHHHNHHRSGRHSERSEILGGSLNRSAERYIEATNPTTLRNYNVRRMKRLRKPQKSRMENEPPVRNRTVEFRLPAVVCGTAKEGESAGSEMNERVREREEAQGEMPTVENSDPNRDLQESCADFFSIIYDNVLEAVHSSVERMVLKCFEDTKAKVDRLSKELAQQENMLKKIYREITGKLAEQNETNMNQFKFLTQMLIDSQTVHYRALSQAYFNKQRSKEERERKRDTDKRRSTSNMEYQRCSTAGDGPEPTCKAQTQHQHQLWQQQAPHFYHMQMCQNCMPPNTAEGKPGQMPKAPRIRRLAKSKGTVSMPNIRRRVQSDCSTTTIRPSHTPSAARSRAPSRQRKATIPPCSYFARSQSKDFYPPSNLSRCCSTAHRKLLQSSKAGPNMEDVRTER